MGAMGHIVFVLGGSRSGKSRLLEEYAKGLGAHIAYVATGLAQGRDMIARIAKHDARRPATWPLHRAPHELSSTIETVVNTKGFDGIVLECLYIWTANQIVTLTDEMAPDFQDRADALEQQHLADLERAIELIRQGPYSAVLTSNEAGLGLAPERRRQRAFRDLVGRVNETTARAADRAFFVVAGHAIDLTTRHVPVSEWSKR
jgi:adenosylcobinamide kinase / adenosylcobinamide-phosphate guanylyltransferase